jgi:hypothetical protein
VEQADIEGSVGIGSAEAIEPEYRLALLREWHCALTSIDTIESEIAELEIFCKKNL